MKKINGHNVKREAVEIGRGVIGMTGCMIAFVGTIAEIPGWAVTRVGETLMSVWVNEDDTDK